MLTDYLHADIGDAGNHTGNADVDNDVVRPCVTLVPDVGAADMCGAEQDEREQTTDSETARFHLRTRDIPFPHQIPILVEAIAMRAATPSPVAMACTLGFPAASFGTAQKRYSHGPG